MDYHLTYCKKHTDYRGYLVEFLKCSELQDNCKQFGQIYFVVFNKPNIVRGNHYHTKFPEWFGAISGKIEVVLEDVNTKERVSLILDGDSDQFVRVYIAPFIAHAFRSISEKSILLSYTTKEYDKNNTDKNIYNLIPI